MSQLPLIPVSRTLTLQQRFMLVEIAASYNRAEAGKEALKLLREISLTFNPANPLRANDPYLVPPAFGDNQMASGEEAYPAGVAKPPA
jgi:hypothetical protein